MSGLLPPTPPLARNLAFSYRVVGFTIGFFLYGEYGQKREINALAAYDAQDKREREELKRQNQILRERTKLLGYLQKGYVPPPPAPKQKGGDMIDSIFDLEL